MAVFRIVRPRKGRRYVEIGRNRYVPAQDGKPGHNVRDYVGRCPAPYGDGWPDTPPANLLEKLTDAEAEAFREWWAEQAAQSAAERAQDRLIYATGSITYVTEALAAVGTAADLPERFDGKKLNDAVKALEKQLVRLGVRRPPRKIATKKTAAKRPAKKAAPPAAGA